MGCQMQLINIITAIGYLLLAFAYIAKVLMH